MKKFLIIGIYIIIACLVVYWSVRDDNEKPYEIIDGQQQLTLISNKKIESLKLEFEVKEQLTKKQEKKWYQIFKR